MFMYLKHQVQGKGSRLLTLKQRQKGSKKKRKTEKNISNKQTTVASYVSLLLEKLEVLCSNNLFHLLI